MPVESLLFPDASLLARNLISTQDSVWSNWSVWMLISSLVRLHLQVHPSDTCSLTSTPLAMSSESYPPQLKTVSIEVKENYVTITLNRSEQTENVCGNHVRGMLILDRSMCRLSVHR